MPFSVSRLVRRLMLVAPYFYNMLKNALLLALCCMASMAHAQDDAMLAWGKVLDATTHKGISANIRYSSIPTGSIYGRFVDSTFSFPIFGVVKYQITAEAQGYNPRTVILDPKDVGEFRKVIRNIVLTPAGEAIRLNHLNFAQGKAQIEPQSYSELNEVVEMMRDNERIIIQLEGHTDNLGDPKANLKLSENRVQAVKKYIASKGISKNRIKTKAFGGSQPVTNAVTPEARNMNRRVEMRILRND
jgi:outer membrane protein OmpA-like peptidoglycan-associated protein